MLWVLSPMCQLLRDIRTQQVVALTCQVSQEFNECYLGMGWGCHSLNGVVTTKMEVVTPKRGLSLCEQELLSHKGGLSPHKWGLSLHKWGGKVWEGTPGG